MLDEDPELPPGPGGAAGCEDGKHACGEVCVPDRANDPAVGCALGCGTPCTPPANGIATCSVSGQCDFTCEAPYARVNGACVLSACEDAGYTCGALVDDNGEELQCGTCVAGIGCGADHQCHIPSDAREPNDTRAQATNLAEMNDADDATLWIDNLSVHDAADEDWFQVDIVDGFDGGDPDALIEIAERTHDLGWLPSSYELTAWFKCATADAGTTVTCGEWYTTEDENSLNDPTLGIGCRVHGQYVVWADLAPSCAGTSDDGVATFRVRKLAAPRGDTYDVYVGVD